MEVNVMEEISNASIKMEDTSIFISASPCKGGRIALVDQVNLRVWRGLPKQKRRTEAAFAFKVQAG
jgi:hypothetical protein